MNILTSFLSKFNKTETKSVVVLDDFFPHPLSAFRFAEYVKLLGSLPQLKVVSTGGSLHFVNEFRSFQEIITDFENAFPHLAGRVSPLDMSNFPTAQLFYTIFINNAAMFIERIEAQKAELIFTLYPGGGFHLDEEACDEKLRRVFSSSSFKKVIVTQKLTLEYLLDKRFCSRDKIEFIFGGIPGLLSKNEGGRNYYGFQKSRLDVAFVANRYSALGAEKGYDVFIAAAIRLSRSISNIHFHVVGKYDPSIIDVQALNGKITFYGFKERDFLDVFYKDIDVIVSPNKPWEVIKGSFDGFPTGSAVEAVLRGVALICSDPYQLNIKFNNYEDIIIVDADEGDIAQALTSLAENPGRLRSIAQKGQATFSKIFGDKMQIEPRIRMLKYI